MKESESFKQLSELTAIPEREFMALIESQTNALILEDDINIDELYEQANFPVKNGEIWQLGNHKLMCGDSSNEEDVNKLMDNEFAITCFTDPPYNIDYSYDKYDDGIKQRWQNIFNDNLTEEEYQEFLKKVISNIKNKTIENAPLFMWNGDRFLHTMISAAREYDYSVNQICTWVKNHFQWSPSTIYHKALEYCVIFFKDGHRPKFINKYYVSDKDNIFKLDFEDFIDLFTLWYHKRDNIAEYQHPTQKPIRLTEKALKAVTLENDIVLDLFGGSGSTLLACEQMKRKCFMMEIDPKYCSVILDRWQNMTNKKATKLIEQNATTTTTNTSG